MSETIYIPPAFLQLKVECYECPLEDTPDVVTGHLIEVHGYSIRATSDWLQDWIDTFATDTDGHPLSPDGCLEHGPTRLGEPCYGCEAVEDAIDRARERQHQGGKAYGN